VLLLLLVVLLLLLLAALLAPWVFSFLSALVHHSLS